MLHVDDRFRAETNPRLQTPRLGGTRRPVAARFRSPASRARSNPAEKPPTASLLAVAVLAMASLTCRSAIGDLVALPENNSKVTVLRDGQPFVDLEFIGWGKNWSWMGFAGEVASHDNETVMINRAKASDTGARIQLTARLKSTGKRQITLTTSLSTDKTTELTYIVMAVTPSPASFANGQLVAISQEDGRDTVKLPLGKRPIGEKIRRCEFVNADGLVTGLEIQPALDVTADGAARLVLAAGTFRSGAKVECTFTITFPEDLQYFTSGDAVPDSEDLDRWFVFQPDDAHDEPSEIGMQDWLEKPAGKHGRIRAVADQLIYNNDPIKLWGLNLCYSACAPDRELAVKRARFYAKYGINTVRLHKYADGSGWAGIQSPDSFVDLDPEGLDRMDFLVAQFKQHGIYMKLSAHFGSQKLGPADKKTVPYLEEFGDFSGRPQRITTPHSAVHYSPELQELQIRQMVNLLQHKNPYTGLTYAEDPAVAFVEIINEQSILFFSSMAPLKASPTLRRYVGQRFCEWLRAKYGTQVQLTDAWGGSKAFDSFDSDGFPAVGEHLDKNNILPLGNPWYWDPAQLESSQAFRRQRLLDSLQFLTLLQNEFYAQYVAAVRKAGYDGEIVSSNWQAGRAASHFYNLHSDALVGTVDRHNYFGGSNGSVINNATMLAVPGSGILSAGMQQVVDRPFMLSEWIHVTPNEWGVEGPAIIGAYGMGLQGWDVSYMFQNRDEGKFSSQIAKERWDVTAPNVMTVFPAVARQILRGDVRQSDTVVTANIHVPSLAEARLSVNDKVTQQYDVKTFESQEIPAQSLAVARCGVRFTDQFVATPPFKPERFLNQGFYTSSTDQLRWHPGHSKLDGFFTIDTQGTKAVVGFAKGRTCALGTVTIQPDCRYAAIYVTAQEPDRDLESSKKWLIVAVARARNTGMKIFNDDRLLERGSSPVLLEPVKARITIAGSASPSVHVLDHGGRRTSKRLSVKDNTFEIDGLQDKTCYYLVTF